MRTTVYLSPIQLDTQDLDTLGQIRSQQGSTYLARSVLLARRGKEGIFLWSRASACNYLLSWDTVRELLREEEQSAGCDMIGEKEGA